MFVKTASGSDGVPLAIIGVEPVSIDEDNNNGVRNYGSLPEATPLVIIPDDQPYLDLKDVIKEAPRFRDLPFLILFLAHLAIILGLAIAYGGRTTQLYSKIDYNVSHWQTLIDDDTTSEVDWKQFEDIASTAQSWVPVYFPRIAYNIILPSALVAYVVSYIWTAVILPACPTAMVVSALLGSVAWTLLLTVTVGMASGFNLFAMLFCGLVMGCVGYYLKMVWKLIPFAAVNLNVALRGYLRTVECTLLPLSFPWLDLSGRSFGFAQW
ncbi:choline transporter-like protein [Fragilaria crotonensis]|nr:choline transporter-like protein [Fragilaria crotonensis]